MASKSNSPSGAEHGMRHFSNYREEKKKGVWLENGKQKNYIAGRRESDSVTAS